MCFTEQIKFIEINYTIMVKIKLFQVARFNKKKRRNALLGDIEGFCEFGELDDIYDEAEGGGACVTCYK